MIESGLLDFCTFIEWFSKLEYYGIVIQSTRIDRNQLRAIVGINKNVV